MSSDEENHFPETALVPPEPVSDVLFEVEEITAGCKLYVFKEGTCRLAEILACQPRKGVKTFYVHYAEFNKRLDEWIKEDGIDFHRPLLRPNVKKEKRREKKKMPLNNAQKKKLKHQSNINSSDKLEVHNEEEMDLDNLNVQGLVKEGEELSREDEIEKLRTSGSMTQNNVSELAKIRNFTKVVIGKHEVEPWYFSPYPLEYVEDGEMFICDFTLSYFASRKQFERFRSKCTLKHPPGNEIYRDDYVSFFEIDGRNQRTWCRNLCLLSKLFLDHKTLYYDVDPFLFYCMTRRDEYGHHLVGYFSKEKESADNYNVACILTLPQYQRHGYGKLLIQFSYELSKKEGKTGSPEKPLSDLGLLSYRAFWSETIAAYLIESKVSEVSVDEISSMTAMTTTDILHTLQTMNMLRYYKGQHIIAITDQVQQNYDRLKKKKRHKIDAKYLQWEPPHFTAAQLRFGF
ncbi:NuA4 histone acetyltransferase complex catalytic subunit [Martiniozyma asiatica (nom. inval.)]|nr:NuA4 histone acetyltransferase complex catalytic subunit [Martiniozyma asiatica]